MAILGVLLTLVSGGVLFADSCKNASIERRSREEATKEGRNVWIDNKGNYRLVGTNEKCYIYDDKLKSLKNGEVIIDYGRERIIKQNAEAIAQAKSESKKYCYLWYTEFCSMSDEKKRRYLTELETGRRYYLTNYGQHSSHFFKKYYTEGKGRISTMLDDWEDEVIEITREEYKELGGYFHTNNTGVYYN